MSGGSPIYLFVLLSLAVQSLQPVVSSQLTERMIDEHCTAQLYACISYWSVLSVFKTKLEIIYGEG